jgi:hypothetical protein
MPLIERDEQTWMQRVRSITSNLEQRSQTRLMSRSTRPARKMQGL